MDTDMTSAASRIVGQDGILRAGWQPALGLVSTGPDGLTIRRRLPTCPTRSEHYLAVGGLVPENYVWTGDFPRGPAALGG